MRKRVQIIPTVQSQVQPQTIKIILSVKVLITVWLHIVVVTTSFPFESTSRRTPSSSLLILNIDRRRQILEPHHAEEIIATTQGQGQGQGQRQSQGSSITIHRQSKIFQDYVKVVCSTRCIPRKELYEAWSSAVLIQKYFPNERRIADLACGHGLLSWSLLLLDLDMEESEPFHENNNCNSSSSTSSTSSTSPLSRSPRTAVCIDRRMPKSAEHIAASMIAQWPQLEHRWDYVESKLENIVMNMDADPYPDCGSTSSSKTLLCGVHACGVLSDQIISLSLNKGRGYGGAPLALVPCCHAKKSLVNLSNYDHDNDTHDNNGGTTLAEYIDSLRIKRLQSHGYNVIKDEIPREYTPQNSVILATPPPISSAAIDHNDKIQVQRKQQPQQQMKRIKQPHLFQVPIGNDRKSIEIIKSLSGRKAAELRKLPPPPSLCVSMFMPKDNHEITPKCLHSVADKIWNNCVDGDSKNGDGRTSIINQVDNDNDNLIRTSDIKIDVGYFDNGLYLHPTSGLYARTFRITYNKENNESISKDRAKQLHGEFCDRISMYIEGLRVRR